MNILLDQTLKKIESPDLKLKILPHQFGSIDYVLKKLLQKENILLFHKMGSGKTIISIILAFFIAREEKKVYIVLPNKNIEIMWKSKLFLIQQLLPVVDYKQETITFITKKKLFDQIELFLEEKKKLQKFFKGCYFIIDEAHTFLGNQGSEVFINLNNQFSKEDRPIYLLLTGSPITNTILTLKDLVLLLFNETISDYYISGKKIFNYRLTNKGKETIKKLFYKHVSFYDKEEMSIPEVINKGTPVIKTPIIICTMSKEQSDNYIKIKKNINNEMFLKYLLDASFTAMGDIKNIYNFDVYTHEYSEHYFTNTLGFGKKRFFGSELKTLNNSCKLKFYFEKRFNEEFIESHKSFIYFSNANIGGNFLLDVLKVWGIQEYGANRLSNYRCYYCNLKHNCNNCLPITFIMITSLYTTRIKSTNIINDLLNVYNSSDNDNGEKIMFLFGSKIISEAYTLTETYEIIYFTIPDSYSEMEQINYRCLRNFSYKNLNKPVFIYILVSVLNEFKIDNIKKKYKNEELITYFSNILENEDNDFSYDLKKILYLDIKSEQTDELLTIFKNSSVTTNEEIEPVLNITLISEIIRRISFVKNIFVLQDIISCLPNTLIKHDNIKNIVDNLIYNGFIVTNNFLNQSLIKFEDNKYHLKPIFLQNKPFFYTLKL